MSWEPAIGLEAHVQLKTRSKLFCGCSTAFGAAPNTQVCPVCLGYPGVLPTLNEEAVRLAVLTAIMLGARIHEDSRFDRKSYFYPDMPKNYQISQYDRPIGIGGEIALRRDGHEKVIRLMRIHLEEDVGRSLHFHQTSGVDFNRAGVPLLEIVTHPDLASPEEAYAFLQTLRQIVRYVGASDCHLEEGNLRCDVNVSLRPAGTRQLGAKTEIKNLNSLRAVLQALRHEIARQEAILRAGGKVERETRRWDPDAEATLAMRSKEEVHDYRYFPEPDLVPLRFSRQQIESWRAALPELPEARKKRLASEYGLPDYDCEVLVADRAVADFFEAAARLSRNPKAVSNWIMTELLRHLGEEEADLRRLPLTPQALAELVALVDEHVVNMPTAKQIFALLLERGGDPRAIAQSHGWLQVSDADVLDALADRALAEYPQSVADYRRGRKAALQFLIGQVMRISGGKANPQVVQALLIRRLEGDKSAET